MKWRMVGEMTEGHTHTHADRHTHTYVDRHTHTHTHAQLSLVGGGLCQVKQVSYAFRHVQSKMKVTLLQGRGQ